MDKILIMGAGIYQVPLIETAKRLGLYTIVASIPGNYPGFALADQVYYINTTDQEAILEVAEKEQISGICTAGTDVAVATIGYVNQSMGLAGVSMQAGTATSDKTMMQDLFKAGGVASAKHIRAKTIAEVRRAAAEIGFPVVIKCVDSSGSRGISIVEREEELAQAFEDALKYSRRDYCLVEEKLPGEEIGIDGILDLAKTSSREVGTKINVTRHWAASVCPKILEEGSFSREKFLQATADAFNNNRVVFDVTLKIKDEYIDLEKNLLKAIQTGISPEKGFAPFEADR